MADTKRELAIEVRVKDQTQGAWGRLAAKAKQSLGTVNSGVKMIVAGLTSMLGWLNRNKLGLAALAAGGSYLLSRFAGSVRSIAEGLSEAAAAAQELNSRFSVVFGDLEGKAADFGEALARGVGRSRQEIRGALADFGQFFEGLGFAEETSLKLAQSLTSLGIDLASFFDQQDAETFALLRSGLIGNSEALDRFGARLSEVSVNNEVLRLGMARSTGEITEQMKVVARISLLQDRWANAQGDAIRTADSFTNRMKSLRAVLANLREEFGERLNQAILKGLATAGGLKKIEDLARVFYASIETLAEVGIRVGADLAKKAGDLIERLGGADGLVKVIQLSGDLAVTWIETVAARAKALVFDLAARIQPLVELVGKIIPDGPDKQFKDLTAEIDRLQGVLNEEADSLVILFTTGQIAAQDYSNIMDSIAAKEKELAARRAEMAALEAKYGSLLTGSADAQRELVSLDEKRLALTRAFQDAIAGGQGGAIGADPQKVEDFIAKLKELSPALRDEIADAAKEATSSVQGLGTAFDQAQRSFRQGTSNSIADTVFRLGEGAKSASEAFKDLGRSILYALLQQRLARGVEAAFGGAFDSLFDIFNPAGSFTASAKGNVMQSGQVKAFAQGGILNGPMAFPMKGGMGIAGEAGPELIAPVKRMSNGDIGIQVEGRGGGGGTLALTINAVDARSVVDLLAGDSKGFVDLVSSAVARSPQLRGILGGAV